jgi:hypothetical protein
MKSILRGTIVGALVAICWTAMVGQDNAMSAKPKSSKPAPSAMQMPKPAPEMTKLIKMMSGSWMVTEKADPSPMMPKGGTGKGTAKLTAGPGGMSMTENYHSSGMMGGSFSGFGTFWWDPKVQAYRGVWCDSMTPNGCDGSGTTKWEGDNLVGTMEGDMNGQKMTTKFTYSDWTANSFVMTMSSGPDANSLKPMMTITYTKAAPAKAEKPTP